MDNNKEKFLKEVSGKVKEINSLVKRYGLEQDVMGSVVIGVLGSSDKGDDMLDFNAVYAHFVASSDELDSINEFSSKTYSIDNNLNIDWFEQN